MTTVMNTLARIGITLAALSCVVSLTHAGSGLATRVIYRCESGDVVTFSDHPCGSEAQEYQTDTSRVSTYEPAPIRLPGRSKRTQPRERTQSKSTIAADPARHAATCARIRQGLADIRSKQRSGYTAKEGERLKARQTKLNQRAREEKCR